MRYITKTDIMITGHYMGLIMQGVGLAFLIPIVISIIYGEDIIVPYLVPALISIGLGTVMYHNLKRFSNLKLKHAMVVSALTWMWMSLIGALILILSLDISFVDALFENMSALTGTGFTMFSNVEILPYSILFLRSFEQWLGGLGIIVIFASIFVKRGVHASKLYLSEAREDKLRPSVKSTLKKTFEIYLILTLCGIGAYAIVGLPLFDAVNLTFTTIATGGMSIKNANVGFYNNNLVYIITMVIMVVGATSFTVHAKIIKTKGKSLVKDVQFQFLILMILLVALIIYLISRSVPIHMLFHVISAISTTGANIAPTVEFLSWHSASIALLFILMLIGGSSGSTSGGIKIYRVLISLKGISHNIKVIMSPERRKKSVILAKRVIKDKDIRDASLFIILTFIFIFVVWFLMILYGYNPLYALFDVISAQSNTGLTTGIISNSLPDVLKVVLIIQMWAGRLEIIPILVLASSIQELFRFKKKKQKKHK